MFSKAFIEKKRRFTERILGKIKDKGIFCAVGVVLKKIICLETLIIYPVSFLLCIVIRLVRPIVFIRFGSVYCEKIGPFAAQPELNLCEQENGIQPRGTLNIYYSGINAYPCCNNQLLKMWKRILYVNEASKYFYKVLDNVKFGEKHIIRTTNSSRDIHGLLEITPVHLSFTEEEIEQAKKDMLKMGIGEEDKYVLMINRGQKYLDEALPGDKDFSYHSYRNCSINDFMPMAEKLSSQGNYVIRMGHRVSDYMETEDPKIIDYDNKGFRTELLDIYLGAHCRYLVGSDTGYFGVPGWLFRRPIVYVNFSQFELLEPWLSSWLMIFRKLWLKKDKRFMSVGEMIDSGAGKFCDTEQFKSNGMEVVKNTPEEIVDVVDEMEQRLAGTWIATEEDEELQRKFWLYFEKSSLRGVIRGRIGAKFLRDNKALLF